MTVKRYALLDEGLEEDAAGAWVLWSEVERLAADNADLRIALQVHSGKTMHGLTKAQQAAIVRGLKLCEAAEAVGEEH